MKLLQVIYGAGILVIIYLVIHMFYSVYYTPGVSVIYNSPVAQALFPMDKAKLMPNWGYTKPLGLYSGQATKFGQGDFWPSSGKGYVPNKMGYPGASPSGGLRKTFPIPDEVSVGHWSGDIDPKKHVNLDIYDSNAEISPAVETEVGWWGN
jgi:hypothetical protein